MLRYFQTRPMLAGLVAVMLTAAASATTVWGGLSRGPATLAVVLVAAVAWLGFVVVPSQGCVVLSLHSTLGYYISPRWGSEAVP